MTNMFRRFILICLCISSLMTVSNASTEAFDTVIEYKEFDSLTAFKDYLTTSYQTKSFEKNEIGEILAQTKHIFLPRAFDENEIQKITVTPTNIVIRYNVEELYFSFTYYHSAKLGASQIDYVKHLIQTNKDKWKPEIISLDGTPIYIHQSIRGRVTYSWEKQGRYYQVVSEKERGKENSKWFEIVKHELNLIYEENSGSLLSPSEEVTERYKNEEETDTLWPGITFKAMLEFETYLSECHKTGYFEKIGDSYEEMGSIYVPKAFNNSQETLTMVAAELYNYYFTEYTVGESVIYFFHYYNELSGKDKYDEAKRLYDKKGGDKNGKLKAVLNEVPDKHEVNGHTVYSYYSLQEAHYVWQQDGAYFLLRANQKPNEKLLELCDAEKIPLKIKYVPEHLASVVRFANNSDIAIGFDKRVRRKAMTAPAGLSIRYSSSNPDVACVSSAGIVKGIAPGNTVITATVTQNGKNYNASYNLAVSSLSEILFGVENVAIEAGTKSRFVCIAVPEKQKINYSSSDSEIATVDESGRITARKPGEAIITGECMGLKTRYSLLVIPKGGKFNSDKYWDANKTPNAWEIFRINPGVDYFIYNDLRCVNASKVEAFANLSLEPSGLAGIIQTSGFKGIETLTDWQLSALPVGTKVYYTKGTTNSEKAKAGDFLLVKKEDKYIPYLLGSVE